MYYTLIIKPDESIRRRVTAIKKKLENLYGYTGALSPKGVHITMAYLKNPSTIDYEGVKNLCNETAPFYMNIGSIGYFARTKKDIESYIIYLKVMPSPEMSEFHSRLIEIIRNNSNDAGEFVPHLTLIRKNVNREKLEDIMYMLSATNFNCRTRISYLTIGKHKSMNSGWNFRRLYFNKI
ncbi:MAG: 2'-5' RNA ligase family protein [Ferroplasma sp.]